MLLLFLHHVHEYNLELYFPTPLAVFQTQHEVCCFFLPLVSRFKQLLQSLLSNKVSCSQLPGFFWKDKSSNGKKAHMHSFKVQSEQTHFDS